MSLVPLLPTETWVHITELATQELKQKNDELKQQNDELKQMLKNCILKCSNYNTGCFNDGKFDKFNVCCHCKFFYCNTCIVACDYCLKHIACPGCIEEEYCQECFALFCDECISTHSKICNYSD